MLRLACLAAIVFTFKAFSVEAAAAHCLPTDTPKACKDKLQAEANETIAGRFGAKRAQTAIVADGLAKKVTGAALATGSDAATSFSDFFTTLKAALDSGSTEHGDDESVGFEISRCLREEVPTSAVREDAHPDQAGTKLQCQLRVRVGGASLYDPIKQALAADVRDQRTKALESGLEFGDAITAGVFFNLAGPSWGRVPQFATEQMFNDIWEVAQAKVATRHADAVTLRNEYSSILEAAEAESKKEFQDSDTFAMLGPARAEQALHAYELATRAELNVLDNLGTELVANRYFDLVDLVNNQPQLNFGVEYMDRDPLAGANEWRAKLVYEYGFVNVNSARNQCRGGPSPQARVACFTSYLDAPSTQKRLKGGDRLALSAEFVQRKKYSNALPSDAVTLAEDSYKSVIGSLSYGFYSSFDDEGNAQSRLDVKANYEDVSNDPKRRDRGTLVGTFSQRVMDDFIVSLSLVYATKPEFRGEVDKELSGRLGFNYKWGRLGAL